jgi:N-acyl-D-amino-acid deacylase
MWPSADSALLQGITTEVVGNCGLGPAPALQPELAHAGIIFCPPDAGEHITWRTYPEFLDNLDRKSLGVNVAGLIPHGPLRISVMGLAARAADRRERDRMVALLREGLESGAYGLSTGLEYTPGEYSELDEVVALAKQTAALGGLYATHVRDRWGGIVGSVEEAIQTARQADCALQVSHLTARRPQADLNGKLLGLMDDAAADGMDIGFDAYPYDWGPGPVLESLPGWVLEPGPSATLEMLADPAHQERIKSEAASSPLWSMPSVWNDVVISLAVDTPAAVGKSIAQLADESSREPWDVIFRLMLDAGEDFAAVSWIARGIEKSSIHETVRHPMCALGSDSATQGGPLAAYKWHPGGYGFTSRVLTELVTEYPVLTFEDAVRRMTSLPASRVGIEGRGAIVPGSWADLAVIDRPRLRDNATYIEPNRSPDGIVHVFVGGVQSVRKGRLTGLRAGRVLRHNDRSH